MPESASTAMQSLRSVRPRDHRARGQSMDWRPSQCSRSNIRAVLCVKRVRMVNTDIVPVCYKRGGLRNDYISSDAITSTFTVHALSETVQQMSTSAGERRKM